jgi:enoyl-CoA hydratase
VELVLTGDPITAERGHELGLVNRLAEPGTALDEALQLADTIGANGPLGLVAAKTILERQWSWSDADFWERQAEIADPVMASEDAREGARAFAEKREPRWQGR